MSEQTGVWLLWTSGSYLKKNGNGNKRMAEGKFHSYYYAYSSLCFHCETSIKFSNSIVNIKLVQMISFQWMFVKLGLRQNVVFKIQIVTMNENFVLYNAGLILTEKLIYKMTDG